MGQEKLVDVRRDGDTCIITLQRQAKLNALSTEMERQIGAAITAREASTSRAIVFWGGREVFSAGADINEMRGLDPSSIVAQYRGSGQIYEDIARLPQPTVSAISGYCLGGGLELALATDFRIADGSAVFGMPEVAIGIVPSSGGTYRLTRIIGVARAKEVILLKQRINASEALHLGMVTEVADDALARARAIAAEVCQLPPLATSVAKAAIDRIPEASKDAAILIEQLAYGMLAQTKDARDAAESFAERRRA